MTHARPHADSGTSRLAFEATIHCLTGCGIGEVLGLGGATLLVRAGGVTLAAETLSMRGLATSSLGRTWRSRSRLPSSRRCQ